MEFLRSIMDYLLTKFGELNSDPNQISVASLTLFVTLICICIVTGRLLKESRWINEAVIALFIGLLTGNILLVLTKGQSSRILVFDEDFFFTYLLPPIIFHAGFKVKKKQFFRNFMSITLFGAVGTLISFCIISLGAKVLFETLDICYFTLQDYLAIGAIFSATDSVCTLQVLDQDEMPLLYSLVFGEGVVNDATSVVLFNAIQKFDLSDINSGIFYNFFEQFFFLFTASTLLGVGIGLLSAFIIKKLYSGRDSADHDFALMFLMAYLSYVMAELFDLSGILTVFFCGVVMSHYTWYNVSTVSRVTTERAFATMSYVSEQFIYLYVGMDALDIEKWQVASNSPGKSVGASSMLLALIMIGRASSVFPLSFLSNCLKKSNHDKLTFKQQFTIWWAGLMRGAVSMALAYNQFAKSGHTTQEENAIMITCTISIVLFSTVVFGLLTKHLVRFVLPPSDDDDNMLSSEPSSPNSTINIMPLLSNYNVEELKEGNETSTGNISRLVLFISSPYNSVHYYWRKFDNAFMRRVFGGRGFAVHLPGSLEETMEQYLLV